MAQVFFERLEKLAQLCLFKLDLSLAKRVDQVTDPAAHDLSSLASIESLLLNLAYQSLHAAQYLRTDRHALVKIVLARYLAIVRLEPPLVFGLLLDQISLFQGECLEGFLKHLLSVDY